MEACRKLSATIFLIVTLISLAVHAASSSNCSPSFTDNITCECTATTAECFGTQTYILEAQEILSDFSSIENITLKINGLQFESDFTFENHTTKILTLGYGLQIESPTFFSGLSTSLISLSLQNVSFKSIEKTVLNFLPRLTELVLDSNEVYNLTANMFINLKELRILKISNNGVSYIIPDFFQYLLNLETLILSHNKMSLLSDINIKSISLKELKIDNCLIDGLLTENALTNIPALEVLDLSHNKIMGIESHSLSTLKNLKILNLSSNAILSLDENAFTEIRNLTFLDLSNNKISVIKLTSFAKLWNLKYLDLSGNKLNAVLCDYTADFTSLESIYLQNNEIKEFTPGAFFYSPNLKVMDMAGNNLVCSCSLTSSFHYLIENSTMESKELEDISCIMQSTDSQIAVIDYKSSFCTPVEPCKKPDVTTEEEEDNEYDYNDGEENLTSTVNAIITTHSFTSLENFTTAVIINTTNSKVSSTDTSLDDSTTEIIINTTNSTVLFTDTSLDDSTTAIPISTTNSSVLFTDTLSDDSTTGIMINTTNSSVSTTEKETEITTVYSCYQLLQKAFETSVDENTSTLTTRHSTSDVGIKNLPNKSTTKTPLISPVSVSKCSSLQLSTHTVGSDTDITILKNSSYEDSTFCLKWTAVGIQGTKTRCTIKYTTEVVTKVKNLVCPSAYEVKEWSTNERVLKFCLLVYPENTKRRSFCELLTSGRSTSRMTLTPTTSYQLPSRSPTTHLPTEITDDQTAETDTSESMSSSETISRTSTSYQQPSRSSTTHLPTEITDDKTAETDISESMSSFKTISSSFSTKSTENTTNIDKIYKHDFYITTFEVYFNDSKLAFTRWSVNKQQPSDDCSLTLKVSTRYFDEIEDNFPCKNSTYRLRRVKEHDTFKVCLYSYHKIHGKDLICRHALPSARTSTSSDDSSYSSLISLICLLILLGIIVIFIVSKNIFQKWAKSKYDVFNDIKVEYKSDRNHLMKKQ